VVEASSKVVIDEEEDALKPVPNAIVKEHYDFLSSAPRLSVENSFNIAPSKPAPTPSKVDVNVKSKVDVRVEVSDGKNRRKVDVHDDDESSFPLPNLVVEPSPEKFHFTSTKVVRQTEATPVLIEPSLEKGSDPILGPIGLITTTGATTVMTGTTTVHETRVVGTVVDGLYAQVLMSTSHIFVDNEEYFSLPNPGSTC
jgi:hypothetical protein